MAAAWLLALAALGYLVVTAVRGQMLIDSLFFLAREAWPLLERTGGTLVAVSSVSALRGDWGQSTYNAIGADRPVRRRVRRGLHPGPEHPNGLRQCRPQVREALRAGGGTLSW